MSTSPLSHIARVGFPLFALAACRPAPNPASLNSPPSEAAIVVAIVVDQLAAWEMHDRFPILPEHGGFHRLAREGAYFENVVYEHSATDTAPGHAALFTGRWPSETGIVQNEVIDGAGNFVSILKDEGTHLVSTEGALNATGASSRRLRAPTVADRLRSREPSARIVGLSLKDRGTLIPTGKACNVCLWFDAGQDRFVTSTAIAPSVPAWANIGSHDAIVKKRETPWAPLDAEWLDTHALTADAQEGEGDLASLGTTFPHRATNGKAFRATPLSDEVLIDLAVRAIDNEHPRLLTLSLSAHDMISHTFGPDSREAFDEILRLDRSIGAFLTALDQRFPNGNYAVVLSADHGSVPMPEARAKLRGARPCGDEDAYKRPCETTKRIDANDLAAEMKREIATALGEGDWFVGIADPFVVLGERGHHANRDEKAALDLAIGRIAGRHSEIERVISAETLETKCGSVEPLLRRVCHSYVKGAGDYFIVPKAGSFFDPYIVRGFGTSHGTPWAFDRTVPLFARGPSVPKGTFTREARSFRLFSRLIGHWLENSSAPLKSIEETPAP